MRLAHVAAHREVQASGDEAMWVVGCPIGDELDVEAHEALAAAREDVRDVGAHTSRDRHTEQLDWRETGPAVAVDDDRVVAGRGHEGQVTIPAQAHASWRLCHPCTLHPARCTLHPAPCTLHVAI